jgi:large subunit ribosomal protein L13Ae
MFRKLVIVDAKGHLLGRLASYIAKELQNGQRVVIVRSDEVLISGSLFRNKLKYMEFLNKRMSTNPKKGPIHNRSPARIIWRSIRGMLKHKSPKGAAALGRLKTFDGVPLSYNGKKRVYVTDALRSTRLKPKSRYCILGDVAAECGWTKRDLIQGLEAKRLDRNRTWHAQRVKRVQASRKVVKTDSEVQKINKELEAYGF